MDDTDSYGLSIENFNIPRLIFNYLLCLRPGKMKSMKMRIWLYMRPRVLISAILLALCILGQWEYSAKVRWYPLDEVQLPAPANSTNLPILSTSGSFRVAVQLPMSKSELLHGLTDGKRVPCNLVFRLYSNNAQLNALTVSTLAQFAANYSSQMDCYDGGTITSPKFGHYILKVENLGDNSQIPSGLFSLIRRENTENAAVLSGVFKVLTVLFGLITLLIIAYDYIRLRNLF